MVQTSASETQRLANAANHLPILPCPSSSNKTHSDATRSKRNMDKHHNAQLAGPASVGKFTTGFRSLSLPQGSQTPAPPANIGVASHHEFQLTPAMAPCRPTTAMNSSFNALICRNAMNWSHAYRLSLVPLFHSVAVLNNKLVSTYEAGSGTLPEHGQILFITSWDWRHWVAIPVQYIQRNLGESAAAVHAALVRIV